MFELDLSTDALLGFALSSGALVVGVGSFLFERRRAGDVGWAFPVAFGLLLCAAATAVAGKAPSSLPPLALLTAFCGALAAARTPIPGLLTRKLVGMLRWPLAAPACLAALGVGLLGWQLLAVDLRRSVELRETDVALAEITPPRVEPILGRYARTDKGRAVQLMRVVPEPGEGLRDEATYLRSLGLDLQLIRTGPVDSSYNCHGWVFAEGVAWVAGESVDSILQDNEYWSASEPLVGDVVVFRDDAGKVCHSALAHAITADGRVLLESKWGRMGRYLHTVDRHPYGRHLATFYRNQRDGHRLLAGNGAVAGR